MRSSWGIFDISIAFLEPENVDFDVLYAILLTFCITSLCVVVLTSAILENGAVCESHAFPTMSSRSFVIPTPMIGFRHADKCWYTAAGTFLFWGRRCSTTILSVGKICIYASQSYTLLMFNGTYVLKMNKNYIYDVTQCVTKYVITCLLYTSPSPRD